MIRLLQGDRPAFALETKNTSYVFAVTESGHPEHLYYGGKIPLESAADCEVFREKREFELGNSIVYSKEHPKVLLEDMCLEMSSQGHGDVREPFLELVYPDGSRSSDFLYDSYKIDGEDLGFKTLPTAYYPDGNGERLCVILRDRELTLELYYRVFANCDVITRSAKLINGGDDSIELERLLSTQIAIPFSGVCVTSFHGAWAREMNKCTSAVNAGKFVIESRAGCSSNRANPFFMVHAPETSEFSGSVYGFNLIYSGNHYSAVEVNAYGKTRIVSGIQPGGFRFILNKDECFEAPEAVMTYSARGFSGQSENMHRFVRRHIVRGEWKFKARPVLLNSWEACYFNISEKRLVSLAKAAVTGKKLGIELFVLDDGWFGDRENDTKALGDWDANLKKLPDRLKGLAEKINNLGMDFGIWVEPEMISVESELYRKHPGWAMAVPGKLHSEGRNQRVLDLANPEVQEFIIKKMTEVFSSANISYVKWDMNRIFSDVFSPYLPRERQGETAHRYICGLYRVMDELTRAFPKILFEGCASGGNRFDLGILCYFPQIWGSDNTDAICRAAIQEGYSYGYPQSCVGAHVSASPNHQTSRVTPIKFRFDVAMTGRLGMEMQPKDMTTEEIEFSKRAIASYKSIREVVQLGDLYRLVSPYDHKSISALMYANDDKSHLAVFAYSLEYTHNQQVPYVRLTGVDENKNYRIKDLTPWNVQKPCFLDNKVVSGRALKYAGLNLKDILNRPFSSVALELVAE